MLLLNEWVYRHYRTVLVIWLVVVTAAVPLGLRQAKHLTAGGFSVPASQSAIANAELKREYPKTSSAVVAVLLWPGKGATPQALARAITLVEGAVRHLPGAALTRQVANLAAFAAELGEPVVLPLKISVSEDQARSMVTVLSKRLKIGDPEHGVETHLLGESALWAGLEETAKSQLTRAETIGFPILFVVLLAIFGSLYAAFLPLVVGVVALIVTGAIIYLVSLFVNLSLFTMDAASMLGIGVAVDYSLIVLARVRQELRGASFDDARRVALAASGVTVTVSGLTCIAALGGVLFIPIGALRSMAFGAAIIIAVSVLTAVTLLPALITLLGRRRVRANLFATRETKTLRRARQLLWDRCTGAVTGHPLAAIVVVGTILVGLCIPALGLRTNTGVLQQLSPGNETRVGLTEAAQLAGPGILGPTSVVLHATRRAQRGYLEREVARLRTIAQHLPQVRRLGSTEVSRNGRYATFTVVPTVDPESEAAEKMVVRLRNGMRRTLAGTGLTVDIGGASATQLDEVRNVGSSMWKVLVAALIISLVPLTALLRSAILPLKAVLMNLLSVGAAYGVLVIVFQWGWLDGLLGYKAPGHIDTLVPPLLLAIVFGLSTDYEVFLLSRIRERWLQSGDCRLAITEGLAVSARTITGAAAIIVCVFAVFVATGIPIIKEIGLGSAFAIGVDATLVRLVLVPAIMTMLGNGSWWWPGAKRHDHEAREPVQVSA